MKKTIETDIVIFGGGIAGLWLLNRLRQKNYSVVLFESHTLGGGQTIASQGIIHGGMKYALQGLRTKASESIAGMPNIWKDCLHGSGEIDLSRVSILSSKQYLWSGNAFLSKIKGFLAGITLKSDIHSVDKRSYPAIFQDALFQGQVYSLDEVVIDIPSLLYELAKPHQDAIYKIDLTNQWEYDASGRLVSVMIHSGSMPPLQIKAKKYIFTAGRGNESLLLEQKSRVKMQRRPLHMVVVKHALPFFSVYGHCLGANSTPRLTITTHHAQDKQLVWYLGGQLAEEGVKRTSESQIQFAKKELQTLFPWLDFSKSQFASFFIDRAEAFQPDGSRPNSCYLAEVGNTIVGWPTKLAFAPLLAKKIIECITQSDIQPRARTICGLQDWPKPIIAIPFWD